MTTEGTLAVFVSTTRWTIAAGIAALPLVCWPAASQPFSTPKLWAIAALDLGIGALYLAAPRRVPLSGTLASVR